MLLENKNIIITGAGRGIGREIAKKLASQGANLALIARTESELKETFDIIQSYGKNYFYLTLDISDEEKVMRVFSEIIQKMDGVYCLINNAGTQSPIGPFHKISLMEWKKNIECNLFGTVNCTYAVIKQMMKKKKGKIINMSGGGATSSRPNFSAYGISKTAIVRFTETLAYEVKDYNIDVNAIAPGTINTRMLDEILEAGESTGKEFAEAIKRKEKGGDSPILVADLISFLASDLSNGITGKLISAQWDNWNEIEFQKLLRDDKDFATLRRIDNKTFYKKL